MKLRFRPVDATSVVSLPSYGMRARTTVWSMFLSYVAGRKPMGTIAASVLAGGLITALIYPVGRASASCDSADCVPNVARNIAFTLPCTPQPQYNFGLDSSGRTYVCDTAGFWVPVGPLVGERSVALPCDVLNQSAQQAAVTTNPNTQPPGVPLRCAQVNLTLRWVYM